MRAATTWLLLLLAGTAAGQAPPLALSSDGAPIVQPVMLAVDADDDDDDGRVDGLQPDGVATPDLVELVVQSGGSEAVRIRATSGLRVIRHGVAQKLPLTLSADTLPTPIMVQGTQASLGQPSLLILERGQRVERIAFHVAGLSLLDANNQPLDPSHQSVGVSQRVTNDRSLPRSSTYEATSADPRNVRLEIFDSAARGKRLSARLRSLEAASGHVRDELELELTRPRVGLPFRSRFVRLVGDQVDRAARGVSGQTLRVALRDVVELVYDSGRGPVRHAVRVGRPGDEDGPDAARVARLHVVVMRAHPGGPPVIGVDELSAVKIVREEIAIANEIWLQCFITFGAASEAAVEVADAPAPSLLSFGDPEGLPARGDGAVTLRVAGATVGPVPTRAGATPGQSALALSRVLEAAGFYPQVTLNPPAVFGAGGTADVMVRDRGGHLLPLEPLPGVPLSTDARQRAQIAHVDLLDGVAEFDNMTATSGTLEERALIKSLADDDPTSLDLFIVNRFTHGTRQGEAFIEGSTGPIANAVVLDRNGLRQRQTAWTMAHELGHVLLNQPLHPDNVGPDRPALLMDSDNNRGTVNGPKRLTPQECTRVRAESGVDAHPSLLRPYDARSGHKPQPAPAAPYRTAYPR